jgi:hypothetical protein
MHPMTNVWQPTFQKSSRHQNRLHKYTIGLETDLDRIGGPHLCSLNLCSTCLEVDLWFEHVQQESLV